MEFGKIHNIENVNWSLPEDDPQTHTFLNSLPKDSECKFYVGAPSWGASEWLGRIYPPKTKAADFLFHYSRNFNCIELNTTHYRIPTTEMVKNWCRQVPDEFHFCPKIFKDISHARNGLRNKELLKEQYRSLSDFSQNLGPSFIQLPPYFTYENKAELFRFLEAWPSEFELLLEFRDPSWFSGNRILEPLVLYLQKKNIGIVMTDVAGRRDVLHLSVSAPFSMLRFIGNDLHTSDFERSLAWSLKIAEWKEFGLKKFYFMVHEADLSLVPEMADRVIEDLNSHSGAGLTPLAKSLI
ncbi:hypothetical protein BDW_04845 [Bdellovibrio bacteriovorus W]|nr:hypothetical protein BDW_04845 [Bdellovibrio bacteriovorus W]